MGLLYVLATVHYTKTCETIEAMKIIKSKSLAILFAVLFFLFILSTVLACVLARSDALYSRLVDIAFSDSPSKTFKICEAVVDSMSIPYALDDDADVTPYGGMLNVFEQLDSYLKENNISAPEYAPISIALTWLENDKNKNAVWQNLDEVKALSKQSSYDKTDIYYAKTDIVECTFYNLKKKSLLYVIYGFNLQKKSLEYVASVEEKAEIDLDSYKDFIARDGDVLHIFREALEQGGTYWPKLNCFLRYFGKGDVCKIFLNTPDLCRKLGENYDKKKGDSIVKNGNAVLLAWNHGFGWCSVGFPPCFGKDALLLYDLDGKYIKRL